MLSPIALKLFQLSKLKGVGPKTLDHVARRADIAEVTIDELAKTAPKIGKALEIDAAWDKALDAVDRDQEKAEKSNTRIICLLDEEYPTLLKQTPDRPFFIYVRGNLSPTPERSVAVIGTREPTEHGKLVDERITEFLVEDGWSIVSGLAMGCDAIAHKKALDRGGHTVAVLAHGLHTIAPRQNERLANEILEKGGALFTEYEFGVEPYPPQFVKRDRIQAGLAQGVVMIQSDLEGGSLHASRASIEYGRILAVPLPTERDISMNERKIGANLLLAGKDTVGKANLLKCLVVGLDRLFVIRSRVDYAGLSKALSGSITSVHSDILQQALF